jgi:hypothetical protein
MPPTGQHGQPSTQVVASGRCAAEDVECALLATGYILGWRKDSLPPARSQAAAVLRAQLTDAERLCRAQALADELAVLTRCLAVRGLR